MRIGIDVDGVLANFTDAAKSIASQLTGKLITDEPTTWDWANWGLTTAQHKEFWKQVRNTPNFWLTLGKLARPTDLISLDKQHTLIYVTTRIPTVGLSTEKQTAYWLSQQFGITCPTVLVSKKKGEVACALELDVFIDDKPENLADVEEHAPTVEVYLQDASYNKNEHRFARVATFEEFAKKYGANNG